MKRRLLALLLTVATGALAAPPQPFEYVRTLQSLQGEAAQGNLAAHMALRSLTVELASRLAQPDLAWDDPRNRRAAILYVLSGGHPAVLKSLLERGVIKDGDLPLAEGALAYVVGDETSARRHLASIDAMSLPAALGAQVALVQAALTARADPKRALALLDRARLLSPGSLVEEAALRREVFIAGETGDHDRLQRATSQYMRRFSRSVYADHFRQSFAAAVVRYDLGRDPEKFARLTATMAAFEDPVQRAVYLVIARDALLAGRLAQARQAATAARKSAGSDRSSSARAALYAAAAQIGAEAPEATLAALAAVDGTLLSAQDRDILVAANRLATSIKAAPKAAFAGRPDGLDAKARAGRLIQSAEQRLAEAEALIAKLTPPPSPVPRAQANSITEDDL